MYRYKCTAIENGSKQDFYDVIGQLKSLYPELAEDTKVRSDKEFLRRSFVRVQRRVTVQYSYSEQSVTVYSEEWLGKYYETRQVTEGRFPLIGISDTGAMWAMSGIYFAVIAVVILVSFLSMFLMRSPYHAGRKFYIIISLVTTVAYTVSGFIIRRKTGIPLLKLIFCQAGGFITVCIMLITANMITLGSYLPYWFLIWFQDVSVLFAGYTVEFFYIFFPALEISFLVQGATELIIRKRRSSKAVKGENIEQTD